jgi:hypothetical protein
MLNCREDSKLRVPNNQIQYFGGRRGERERFVN